MIRISAYLALAFGVFLFIGEVVRNWGDWQWWPFWVVDYIAASLLIFGGQRALKTGTVRWLTGGWGFTAAMFWMSFFFVTWTACGTKGPARTDRSKRAS